MKERRKEKKRRTRRRQKKKQRMRSALWDGDPDKKGEKEKIKRGVTKNINPFWGKTKALKLIKKKRNGSKKDERTNE